MMISFGLSILLSTALARAAGNALPILEDQPVQWNSSRADVMKVLKCEVVTVSLSSHSFVKSAPHNYPDSIEAICQESKLGENVLAGFKFEGDQLKQIQMLLPLADDPFKFVQQYGGANAAEDLSTVKRSDDLNLAHHSKDFTRQAIDKAFAKTAKFSFQKADEKMRKAFPGFYQAEMRDNTNDFLTNKVYAAAWSYDEPDTKTAGMVSYSKDNLHSILVTVFPKK